MILMNGVGHAGMLRQVTAILSGQCRVNINSIQVVSAVYPSSYLWHALTLPTVILVVSRKRNGPQAHTEGELLIISYTVKYAQGY